MLGQVSRTVLGGFLFGAVLLTATCGTSKAPARPSAILVTIDTLRADALSPYGAPRFVSPYLERLAVDCVRYTQARSVAPLTLPAHASMLTGLYPPRHGLRDNGLCALPAEARSIAEVARGAGIQTAAFVSALVLDRAFALDQGFDTYDQPPRPEQQVSSHYVERSAAETVASARAWMAKRDSTQPFFLWVHLYDPHVPYAPPAQFLEQTNGNAYRGEIAAVDAALGPWLQELKSDGTLAQTFLAITSDHGESLGEHGEPTHGAFCYDATMHIPLLVRYPDGRRGGSVADELVTLADVAPTLASAMGLPELPDIDGVSLYDRTPPADRGVYCESYSGFLNYGWSPLAGWIAREGKYLHSSRPEFFNLRRDARELHDLFPAPKPAVGKAKDAMSHMLAQRVLLTDNTAAQIPEDLVRDLRQLGYGASGTTLAQIPHPLEPSELPAPRDGAAELEPLLIASALLDARNFGEGAAILARIVADNPRHLLALDLYGFALLQLERNEEARSVLSQRATLGIARADTLVNWAVACERSEHPEEAREHFEAALALDSASQQALEGLLRLARARADGEQVRELEKRIAAARQLADGMGK